MDAATEEPCAEPEAWQLHKQPQWRLRHMLLGMSFVSLLIICLQNGIVPFAIALSLGGSIWESVRACSDQRPRLRSVMKRGAVAAGIWISVGVATGVASVEVIEFFERGRSVDPPVHSPQSLTPTSLALAFLSMFMLPALLVGAMLGQLVWATYGKWQHWKPDRGSE